MDTTSEFSEDLVALFPGQGSLGERAGVAWLTSANWDVVARVSDVSDTDVERLLCVAGADEVVRTDNAQLATFALSMVGYLDLVDQGVRPRYLLGHSLGEYGALVASGLLTLEEGARLISVRGRAMARAALHQDGTMVALMGAGPGAREALDDLENVWVANINGSDQIVVSGTRAALGELVATHRALGWRRASPLAVGGAFHSPLMSSAQVELDRALAQANWGTTDQVIISNVDGRRHASSHEWRKLLSEQLTSPIEFLRATEALPNVVRRSVEAPPGAVLSGLTKRIRSFDHQYTPASPLEVEEITP